MSREICGANEGLNVRAWEPQCWRARGRHLVGAHIALRPREGQGCAQPPTVEAWAGAGTGAQGSFSLPWVPDIFAVLGTVGWDVGLTGNMRAFVCMCADMVCRAFRGQMEVEQGPYCGEWALWRWEDRWPGSFISR